MDNKYLEVSIELEYALKTGEHSPSRRIFHPVELWSYYIEGHPMRACKSSHMGTEWHVRRAVGQQQCSRANHSSSSSESWDPDGAVR